MVVPRRFALGRQWCLCLMLAAAGCGGGASYSQEGPDGPNAETEFRTTGSGLRYRILREGYGSKPKETNIVRVSYRGWLQEGPEFDSSYLRGEPAEFGLRDVIPGWTEGLQLIGEGGKIELQIPYDLGYGERGMPPEIPPRATLNFVVELHKVL